MAAEKILFVLPVEDSLQCMMCTICGQTIYTLIVWITVTGSNTGNSMVQLVAFLAMFFAGFMIYRISDNGTLMDKLVPVMTIVMLVSSASTLIIIFLVGIDIMFFDSGGKIFCMIVSSLFTLFWA